MSDRGGAQFIPRPTSSKPGAAPPWGPVVRARPRLSLEHIRVALGATGAPRLSALEHTGVRASAVLVPLYEEDGEVKVVLTRRAQNLRSHRGEVSFPGGGQEAGEDLRITALREAAEEVALEPSLVEIVGELDHLQTVTSRSFIVPYVGFLPGPPELRASPSEVELILRVSLSDLLLDGVYREERWGLAPLDRPIHFFEIVGDTIWGATATMLRNLLAVITGTTWRDNDQWGDEST